MSKLTEIIQSAHLNYKDLKTPYIERAKIDQWSWITSEPTPKRETEVVYEDLDASHLSAQVIVDPIGNITIKQSDQIVEQGALLMPLAEAFVAHPELMERYFGSVIAVDEDQFVTYNLASLTQGLLIYIPRGVSVYLPIEVTIQLAGTEAIHYRQLVIADDESQVNLVERFETDEDANLTHMLISEVIVEKNARVHYSGLDSLGAEILGYLKRYATVGRDGHIDWSIGEFNDGNVVLDLDTYLVGNGSQSEVAVVGVSTDEQQQIIDSKVVNDASYSIGNIFQHGVILDRARLSFNGIGLIEKGAKNADAQQESRVLMLTDEARGDANPILLIEEFEVTAGHAASSGQVDQDQMYYLMSRGISREVAEYLVVRGFLGPVLKTMPSKEIRDACLALMDRKLSRNYDVLKEIGESDD